MQGMGRMGEKKMKQRQQKKKKKEGVVRLCR